MIDHRREGSRQGVGMVLEKPASAGFLLSVKKCRFECWFFRE
ncbi:hypothetical protein [Pseudomonas cichorii]|nr:hypothetical protein [Pseudomonas cichorii]